MTPEEELEHLWNLAIPKAKGWQQHDCPVLRADRGDFESVWKKMRSSVELNTVVLAIQAQARFRRDSRKAGDFVPQPKIFASWLRKRRWLDEIDSHEKIRENKDNRLCKCGKPVHGPAFDKCGYCLGFDDQGRLKSACAEKMREYYKQHPEIKTFTRQQAVAFIKKTMRERFS